MIKKTGKALFAVGAALSGCADMEGGGDDESIGQVDQAITATTQTETVASAMESEVRDLPGFEIIGIEPVTATVFDLKIAPKVQWVSTINTEVSWDSDKVRQGQTVEVSRKAPVTLGTMKVVWTLTGQLRPLDLFGIDIGTIPIGLDVGSCAPKLEPGGTAYDCDATSDSISIVDTPLVPASPYVNIKMGVKFTITPDNGIVTRSIFLGDEELVPSTDLDLTTGSLAETFPMPCNKPAGQNMQYVLDPLVYAPAVHARTVPMFEIGVRDPVGGVVQLPALFSGEFGIAQHSDPDLSLAGAGNAVDMGELLPNNVLPTISPLGPFAGNEGAPVSFSASVQSACPITSYVWQFSDGTQSYGPTPQRSFGDDGVFDGQLTVKDATNLSAIGSFDVTIANKPPVANAGPDTSAMWGTSINLQGQAVDPGANDQATLVYSWNFGDGTPGIGGANVNHVYTQPGDYVATFKACDDHVCSTDTVNVHVRKRLTQIAYTGSNTGTHSAPTNLTASLTDELGTPVAGASIALVLAGVAMGSAQTNASGTASKAVEVTLPFGSYQVEAGYAGSSLYEASQTAEQFDVAQMSSVMAYTGSLSGGPNKTVNLSAKLVDGLNRPLAGKLVTFKLGTQQVSASTDATGLASTSLKLSQKAGQYPLTATWTPVAGDATKWTGSASAATFKLQSK